jgi:hypothetical protein
LPRFGCSGPTLQLQARETSNGSTATTTRAFAVDLLSGTAVFELEKVGGPMMNFEKLSIPGHPCTSSLLFTRHDLRRTAIDPEWNA